MVHEVSFIKSLNLSLNLNYHDHDHDQDQDRDERLETKSLIKLDQSLPSLTLGLGRDQDPINLINQQQASNSTTSLVSSFSNSTSTKRERDAGGEEVGTVFSKEIGDMDQDDFEVGARKKLRLTKKQSFVLEENFKQHSTLNPKQKQTLAESLNLRPRQVEVWFQNRRARTKLKQNEVECALLKKCCEALTSDNKKLKREIQQLKALKTTILPPQFYMQFPAPVTHTMCPSCERINSGNGGDVAKLPFSREQKSHSHLFSQLC
ncbi:homeobox-leucine zipper protein HAT9-like [Rutidosis leptorrhynchoides]|uniref:homeobox-leucine zipper protein HAT9-like n=1 Tax=Rutidosis leptorrhynchoides TaxID=125765 RepID=UPI003A9983C5